MYSPAQFACTLQQPPSLNAGAVVSCCPPFPPPPPAPRRQALPSPPRSSPHPGRRCLLPSPRRIWPDLGRHEPVAQEAIEELERPTPSFRPRRKWPHTMVHFKNRYMVMEVFIDVSRGESDPVILTHFNVTKAIRDSIQLNFGECGLAASLGSLQVKYVNPLTKLCLIRVSREDHHKVWAAITMVRSIGKVPVSFNLLDVSGTIRACKKAALECEEAKFEQYKLAVGDRITPEILESIKNCFDKIRGLES